MIEEFQPIFISIFFNEVTDRIRWFILQPTFINVVKNYIDSPINQNQFDALVSLAYNIGNRNFRDSTIRQQINNSDFNSKKYPTLESAWKAWNISQGQVSKGLINRRKDEWDLYKTGNYQISTAG